MIPKDRITLRIKILKILVPINNNFSLVNIKRTISPEKLTATNS